MKSKKGAIELSMTTIIVIVLGVTLLILGGVFIKKIFGDTLEISDETFATAKSQLTKLENLNQFLTLNPKSIKVEQGQFKAAEVILLNQGREEISVKATIDSINDDKLTCLFYDTKSKESDSYPLSSGEHATISVVVQDNNGGLRPTGCRVTVQGAPTNVQNSGTIIVEVIKSEGFFK